MPSSPTMLVAAAFLAGFGTALAGTADAATLSWSALPKIANPNPLAVDHAGIISENVTDSIGGVQRSPWDYAPPSLAAGGPFSVIGCDNGDGACEAWALYDFAAPMKQLRFVWGSPDGYNRIEFLLGGQTVDMVDGMDVVAVVGNGGNVARPFVTIGRISGGHFDAVRFVSTAPAFEYANLSAAAVPLPATGFLLIGSVAGLLALRRPRKGAADPA